VPQQPPVIGILTRHDHSSAGTGYRLYGQGAIYCEAVALAGGAPVLIPLELGERAWRSIYRRLDGLLLPGGVDVAPAYYGEDPQPKLGKVSDALDEAELVLTHWALEDGLPLFGVCRGIQLINVAAGGSLYQDLPTQFPGALRHRFAPPKYTREHRGHLVHIQPDSRLAQALGSANSIGVAKKLGALEVPVNSRHHQAVKDVAPGFVVTARAPDGVIEGLEIESLEIEAPQGGQTPFVVGVQWHPENLAVSDPQMLGLFQALVDAAAGK
jgi:putative glutamine amidotransferase